MNKLRNNFITAVIILMFVVGTALVLYPTVSDWWNTMNQSRAYTAFMEKVVTLEETDYADIRNAAHEHNRMLLQRENTFWLSDEEIAQYNQLLNVTDSGIMGRIRIPKMDCIAPIYHGTDSSTLQIAIGHLEWSSLPVGGSSTHCVLSGHRGLPSAKLFTDLNKLVIGDQFELDILDETLIYEVDQILTVDPWDSDSLLISEGEDYCTLITCTPYGINTHRLLVRGHRVFAETEETVPVPETIPAEAPTQPLPDPLVRKLPIPVVLLIILMALVLLILLAYLLVLLLAPTSAGKYLPKSENKNSKPRSRN